MKENKPAKLTNSKKEYEDALATADPTKISDAKLQDMAKNAVKKFKSLS